MTTRRVTISDTTKLRQHLLAKAPTCVHAADGLLPRRFVIPTYDALAGSDDHSDLPERSAVGHYLQMYDWDACLFSQGAHRLGIEDLAVDVVGNFVALQREDGFIPRTVSPGRIWDQGDLCKPFLSQSLLAQMKRTNWAAFAEVEPLLDSLARFLQYFRNHRLDESGLFFWRNVLESGIDNNYALLSPMEAMKDENQTSVTYPDGLLLASDLNSYLFAEFTAFSELCSRSQRHAALSIEYANLAAALAARVEELLWDEELGLYVNVNPGTGTAVRLRSWTGILPVLFGISSDERADRVLNENVLSEEHFLQPFGVASMAASEPLSNQAPRGLYGRAIVCNWNGPVWVLPSVLIGRCLVQRGRVKEAREVARRVVAAMVKDLKATGVLHENYRADTGVGLWAPQFMSWNVLALELLDLLAPGKGRHGKAVSSARRGSCGAGASPRKRTVSNRRR